MSKLLRVIAIVMVLNILIANPIAAAASGITPNELGIAAVKAVEKYPTRTFYTQTYDLLYAMKASKNKTILLKKMQNIKSLVAGEQILRARDGLEIAEMYPNTVSYNVAIHRIEKVQSDEIQIAYKAKLLSIVKSRYVDVFVGVEDFSPQNASIIEACVAKAESNKKEPYLTEGDEAVRNMPYGSDRTKMEERMKEAHKTTDDVLVENALKSVDVAAVSDDSSRVVVAIDAIDQVADDKARLYLEQRLFQFKVRSMSRMNLVPYLKTLPVPSNIKASSLTLGNALNWVLIAENKPTKANIKKALDVVAKLENSMEKDFLSSRLSLIQ